VIESRVKKLLSAGAAAWGASLPDASDLIAKLTVNVGVDFLWIDLEHRSFEIEAVKWIPIICRGRGCTPLVRVAGLDSKLIKKALDAGASAIMVPQVDNPEQARRAVEYAKYPPQGTRGCSPLWTTFMDVSWDEYLPAANDETCVVVQVESAEAIRNVEAIAAVDGVDVVFAGPLDLSAALGHIGRIEHPSVQQFLAEFPARVASTGKASGTTVVGYEAAAHRYSQGYRFIAFGNLITHGKAGLEADLKRLRAVEPGAAARERAGS
jgi:2-keto-3-deoxy-L-rhamnonate aldolase RhmA